MRVLVPVMIVALVVLGVLAFKVLSRNAAERRSYVGELRDQVEQLVGENARLWVAIDQAHSAAEVWPGQAADAILLHLPASRKELT